MKKRLIKTFIIVLLAAIFSVIFIGFIQLIKYRCPYRVFFHIYCAGCGTTRMIKSIFELHFYQAFRFNPLMFILIIIFAIYLIYFAYKYIKDGKFLLPNYKVLIIIFITLIIYMILRNIPLFYFLRPKELL